jgi:C-terminal processing protease CtpA/Prc
MNYDRREIYLLPNTHYREPFDYGYTGLSFYYIDGYIRVTEVMKGSPAETAGLNQMIF